jgi:hypothetical protein
MIKIPDQIWTAVEIRLGFLVQTDIKVAWSFFMKFSFAANSAVSGSF